jgi:ATP-dependent RNA circularization protein (DNA/RNA ligase family)
MKAVNVGKKNELSASQQAFHTAEKDWSKQLDKGYLPEDLTDPYYLEITKKKQEQGGKNTTVRSVKKTIKKVDNLVVEGYNKHVLPMCANVYSSNFKKYFDYEEGVYVQPKLDGFRCIAQFFEGEVVLTTRSGKQYPWLKKIRESLLPIFEANPNIVFDGEVYAPSFKGVPTETRFNLIQKICSMSIKEPHPREDEVQYWIFDVVDTDLEQLDRFSLLDEALPEGDSRLVRTPTFRVNSEEEMNERHVQFVNDNFEGTMIRSVKLKYIMKNRSQYLRKYKNFSDSEFKIVGAKEGEGTEKGCVVWRCEVESGKQFDVRPKGTFEERQVLWDDREEYIGRLLKVEYQELTGDGIPRFPRGICIRDEFDL